MHTHKILLPSIEFRLNSHSQQNTSPPNTTIAWFEVAVSVELIGHSVTNVTDIKQSSIFHLLSCPK